MEREIFDVPLNLDNIVQYAMLSQGMDAKIKERCKLFEDDKVGQFTDWRFLAKELSVSATYSHGYYINIPLADFIECDSLTKIEAFNANRKLYSDMRMKEIISRNKFVRDIKKAVT